MNNYSQGAGLSSVSGRPSISNTGQHAYPANNQAGSVSKWDNGALKSFGVVNTVTDPSQSGSASDRIAGIVRSEWDDYVTRFQPRDKQLLGIATGDIDNKQAIERSRESVATGFNTARGSLDRDMSRMGLSSMPDEVQQRDASSGLAQAAAEVSAVNGARIHTQDRDMKLMSGDMSVGLRGNRLQGGA